MKGISVMALGLGLAVVEARPPEVWSYELVESYPHDRGAFTQGLYYDGATLVLGTGRYGGSSIRIVDLTSGKTLRRQDLDGRLFGEGVARHGKRLYQLTWKAGEVLVYDAASLERRKSLRYRGEGWGVTSDGKALITSNGSEVLTGRDPDTFAPLWELRVTMSGRPLALLNELEFVKGRIFANVWKSDQVVVISPESGEVEAVIDFSDLVAKARRLHPGAGVLNGIAYDARRELVLVTGKNWDRIYAVRHYRATR